MPLTEFQAEIARLLAANRSPDSYLAGGAALHIDIKALKREWLAALDQAAAFIGERPSEEIGCLYYSTKDGTFVTPSTDMTTALPPEIIIHYGGPGGIVPQVIPREGG